MFSARHRQYLCPWITQLASIYEAASARLARIASVQLWKAYLDERRLEVRGLAPDDQRVKALNNTYERALVYMHKMPRIWLDYLDLLMPQNLVTFTRRAFDRSLCSLPITQHDRIWQVYLVRPYPACLKFAKSQMKQLHPDLPSKILSEREFCFATMFLL